MSTPMNDLGIVKRNILRADKAAVEKLSRFGVATSSPGSASISPSRLR